MLTAQKPNDALYHSLIADPAANERAGIRSISRIGDCYGPATIAAAVKPIATSPSLVPPPLRLPGLDPDRR